MSSVSVCIPTFNQAQYLEDCINSVLRQTRLPDEIIISDDNSSDKTAELIKKFQREFPFIHAYQQPSNLGLTKNSNFCLKKAEGEFIVRLSSDDFLLPDYIMLLSNLLRQYKNAGYAHSAVQEVNNKGKVIAARQLFRKKIFESDVSSLRNSLQGFKVAANILMFRKDALEKVNFINCTENFAEDYFLAVEIAAKGYGNVYCDKPLACYRVWNDNNNIRVKRKITEINGLKEVFNRAIEPAFIERKWPLQAIEKAKNKFAIAQSDALGRKDFSQSEKHELKKALLSFSSTFKSRLFYAINSGSMYYLLNGIKKIKSSTKNKIKQFLLNMRKPVA